MSPDKPGEHIKNAHIQIYINCWGFLVLPVQTEFKIMQCPAYSK